MSDDASLPAYSNAKADTNIDPTYTNPRSTTKPLSKRIQISGWDMPLTMVKTNIRKESKMAKDIQHEMMPSERIETHHFSLNIIFGSITI